MSKTKIEWATDVWNPVVGCSVVSPGCTNCYAMRMAARIERMQNSAFDATEARRRSPYAGLTPASKGGPVWNGKVALASDETLIAPFRWNRRRRIFVNSMGDLFHEAVPDAWIDRVFAVMALAPQHTFQVLTKRSKQMREYLSAAGLNVRVQNVVDTMEPDGVWEFKGFEPLVLDDFPLKQVWLGVSAEDQPRADERIPDLLATQAAVRFVSCEPLLGPIDLTTIRFWSPCRIPEYGGDGHELLPAFRPHPERKHVPALDWVIVGSESGPGARPCDLAWVRAIKDQCVAASVPFFWKQHVVNGRKISTPEMDGRKWAEFPQTIA